MNKVSIKDRVKRNILRFIIKNRLLYKFFNNSSWFNIAVKIEASKIIKNL